MPYKKFKKGGKFCIKNLRTGKVTCYGSEKKRKTGIKMREAFAHGWKPTRLKTTVRKHTRRTKRKTTTVKQHSRKIKRPKYKTYKKIYKKAKKKGYKIPKLDLEKGPTVVDEVNIPERFEFDGFVSKLHDSDDEGYFIGVDDDTIPKEKKKTY